MAYPEPCGDVPRTITIAPDVIMFGPCCVASHHPQDIANVYCGYCHTHLLDLMHRLHRKNQKRLPLWTIYDHPDEAPAYFVARLYYAHPRPEATKYALCHHDLDGLRAMMPPGTACLTRRPEDDLKIIEVWL